MTMNTIYKYLLLLPAIALLATTACTTDSDEPLDNDIAIGFTCSAEQTRATYVEYTGGNFGVQAITHIDGSNTALLMDNLEAKNNGGYWKTDDTYYWTEYPIHFAAYSPYKENLDEGPMKITLPQTINAGYKFEGTVDGETNLMFANEQYGSLDDFTNGRVPINFNHALTQVKFTARVADDAADTKLLNIESLVLKNIRNTGSITFPHNANTADMLWTVNSEEHKGEYALGCTEMTGIDKEGKTFDDCLYLMPQELYTEDADGYQQFEITFTINGEEGTGTLTLPLRVGDIQRWTVNKAVTYNIVVSPTKGVSLTAVVQDWNLEEKTNEFSNIVTIDKETDRITWIPNTYDNLTVTPDACVLTIKPDINVRAEFSFKIGHPVGATWYATLRTISGNPNAFRLVSVDDKANIVDGVAVGAVGDAVTLAVQATDAHPSVMNKAELYFVVRCNGEIKPVHILTANNKNFVIIQNINI